MRLTPETRATAPRRGHGRTYSWPIALWTLYLAMAPITWFPGIVPAHMSILKGVVFAGAVVTTWLAGRDQGLPTGLLGPLGLIAVLIAAMPAAFQAASLPLLIRGLYALTLPFLTMWAFWRLPKLDGNLLTVIRPALIVAALLGAVIFMVAKPLEPAWLITTDTAAWFSGFGGKKTLWSHQMAALAPFFMYLILTAPSRLRRFGWILAMGSVVGGQIALDGRGGLVTTALIVILALAARFSARAVTTTLGVAVLIALPILSLSADETTAYRPTGPQQTTFESLNDLSTGRLELTSEGWLAFLEDPVVGRGFGNDGVGHGQYILQVHIMWLRMAVEGGIMPPFIMAVLVAAISRLAWRNYREASPERQPARIAIVLVILAGIAATFVEPNAIAGSFHGAALWWAAAGVAARHAHDHARTDTVQTTRYWLKSQNAPKQHAQ